MNQARPIPAVLGAAAAIPLVLAGCGGDDDDAAPAGETTTTEAEAVDGTTTTAEGDPVDETPAGPLAFEGSMALEPVTQGDEDVYPLGEPGALVLELGSPEPATDEEVEELFGEPGGDAERRAATLSLDDVAIDLGQVVLPTQFPADLLERNAGRSALVIADIRLDDVEFVPAGTPAAEYCSATDTGEVVGGWRYDGSPGELSVAFTIDVTDGGRLDGVGVLAEWTSPFVRELFDGVDLTGREDRCTAERGITQWGGGVLAGS